MSSGHRFVKRSICPDSRYGSVLVSQFINMIMLRGKKRVAEGIFYGAMDIIREKVAGKESEFDVLLRALANVTPASEVCPKRVGGATYQVPVEVKETRRRYLSFRLIIISFRKMRDQQGITSAKALAEEILLAAAKTGNAYKMCEDKIKMAEANRTFSHIKV